MAEFRTGSGRYEKSLKNLFMPDIKEVFNMMGWGEECHISLGCRSQLVGAKSRATRAPR